MFCMARSATIANRVPYQLLCPSFYSVTYTSILSLWIYISPPPPSHPPTWCICPLQSHCNACSPVLTQTATNSIEHTLHQWVGPVSIHIAIRLFIVPSCSCSYSHLPVCVCVCVCVCACNARVHNKRVSPHKTNTVTVLVVEPPAACGVMVVLYDSSSHLFGTKGHFGGQSHFLPLKNNNKG